MMTALAVVRLRAGRHRDCSIAWCTCVGCREIHRQEVVDGHVYEILRFRRDADAPTLTISSEGFGARSDSSP
jgi:hypothetical protein